MSSSLDKLKGLLKGLDLSKLEGQDLSELEGQVKELGIDLSILEGQDLSELKDQLKEFVPDISKLLGNEELIRKFWEELKETIPDDYRECPPNPSIIYANFKEKNKNLIKDFFNSILNRILKKLPDEGEELDNIKRDIINIIPNGGSGGAEKVVDTAIKTLTNIKNQEDPSINQLYQIINNKIKKLTGDNEWLDNGWKLLLNYISKKNKDKLCLYYEVNRDTNTNVIQTLMYQNLDEKNIKKYSDLLHKPLEKCISHEAVESFLNNCYELLYEMEKKRLSFFDIVDIDKLKTIRLLTFTTIILSYYSDTIYDNFLKCFIKLHDKNKNKIKRGLDLILSPTKLYIIYYIFTNQFIGLIFKHIFKYKYLKIIFTISLLIVACYVVFIQLYSNFKSIPERIMVSFTPLEIIETSIYIPFIYILKDILIKFVIGDGNKYLLNLLFNLLIINMILKLIFNMVDDYYVEKESEKPLIIKHKDKFNYIKYILIGAIFYLLYQSNCFKGEGLIGSRG